MVRRYFTDHRNNEVRHTHFVELLNRICFRRVALTVSRKNHCYGKTPRIDILQYIKDTLADSARSAFVYYSDTNFLPCEHASYRNIAVSDRACELAALPLLMNNNFVTGDHGRTE